MSKVHEISKLSGWKITLWAKIYMRILDKLEIFFNYSDKVIIVILIFNKSLQFPIFHIILETSFETILCINFPWLKHTRLLIKFTHNQFLRFHFLIFLNVFFPVPCNETANKLVFIFFSFNNIVMLTTF
jgi:hypothetical protein